MAELRNAISDLVRALRKYPNDRLPRALTSVLFTIALHENAPLTVGELAASERLTSATVSRALTRLEDKGLIERVSDKTDRRANRVRLTTAGRREHRQIRAAYDIWWTENLGKLGSESLRALIAALPAVRELNEAMDPSGTTVRK